MSINQVIVDIILFAVAALLGWAIKTYVIPFIQDKHLADVAKIVVNAAEALIGAGNGEEKFNYCLEQIQTKYNINVDLDIIKNAIEAAWNDLNTEQIAIGTKEIQEENNEE